MRDESDCNFYPNVLNPNVLMYLNKEKYNFVLQKQEKGMFR
jgi:hypothetical protein